ncbi:hypothetical protein [uncultured Clostridium sp.]|uniref:hypothetical protein n=1 Tax=uncultured Clostridium sp. TaxID=59620 RepID=UPI0028E8A001|nr:hypothetical protein [uncultured Clostridium sp.]
MQNKNDNNFNEVVRLVHKHTADSIGEAMFDTGIVLGTLTDTGLQVDNFKHEINDYKQLENENITLSSGDRVLVAVFGADYIIIGKVKDNA